ncbi:MAG: outer membrane protein assembly factor BamD [Flavobacteriales bacterium]|nr:outer membrane protein assembly factor BamD [Flavobacteriia bacterium]NCP05627.1 outer membrane protein assembly factor BamD [Flavobacteriales bacterium]PIV94668.1 MAG: outer membrane protein assembly factor BamD [Flavobacteriaceae bacterium CG17_big_fil_post_rev_8_21_14_2_50_33_15]PIY09676.1 MAG: outer membrane protein assembly factor BamD [Flavobacteriaceae bacterium CG_4_10_14_3_um_filter_33_47]PJB16562.1 MAG: outer membrane protein assembly factor BamD [Flavobacteriaceae bacterium CG_4_9
MNKYIYIIILLVGLSSCSEYQKALKSEDTATKFKLGEDLYNEGKYDKANKLFAQIVPNYRGKPQAEKLMYLYSQSFYKMNDYYIAGYQFERFASSYPKSEKLAEASFLSAKSNYMLSPIYTKDQTETKKAIEKLQEFINAFPDSEYIAEANKLVKELDYKLENKAYSIAKQYDQISDYEASIKSFDNFIFDFPGSTLREDALFYKLDATYKLAINSVERKKQIRLNTAKTGVETFNKAYPNSKHVEEVNAMFNKIQEELKQYSNKANI